jgi:Tol biopolymer transport system component
MKKQVIAKDVQFPRYVPSGHLVYIRAGAVEAVPFDLAKRKLTGRSMPVLDKVLMNSEIGTAQFAFSDHGLLIYAPGDDTRRTIPTWVDRKSKTEEQLPMPARFYGALRLSPDGTRLAIEVKEENNSLRVYDITRGTDTRLIEGGIAAGPVWAPDSRRILFSRYEESGTIQDLLLVSSDGSGQVELLASLQRWHSPWSWSPDGKFIALHGPRSETSYDIFRLSMEVDAEPELILGTEYTEWAPSFSPDGRWLAYSSNRDGGGYQTYVCPYPSMIPVIRVSKEMGEEPIWSTNGDELFYRSKDRWMVASISREPEFKVLKTEMLFQGPYGQVGGLSYDVTSDGQKFLVLKPQFDDTNVKELRVVTNWFEELKQLAPPDDS